MKKFKWMMAGESFDAIGGSMMRFHCEDFPGVTITRCNFRVPYAHKKGYWIAKKYFAEAENGLFREFRTKRECMEFVESGGLARFQKEGERV
ncbi:hypothetical protein [Oribacterium sp. Sow4_G1_1]|uniref:hypothetical protein n=1 Tax=Oribacterium sp. Sow4_G1_1 TaxID=3438794 RepID=UPI003F9C1A53